MNGRRVRLTLISDSDTLGGAETYLLQLLRHLPQRFAPTLLVTRPAPALLLAGAAASGVPTLNVEPVRSKWDVPELARLARALASTHPDIVHINQTIPANNRHAIAVAAALRQPALATLHLPAPIGSARHRTVLRLVYRRLRRVIAVSQHTRAQLIDELHVPPGNVPVVANGVEYNDAVAIRDAAQPMRIAAMGRLTEQKGFDLLIEAVRILQRDGITVNARIAGDGPELERLQRLAGGTPVRFVPFVTDVSAFLGSSDVFCLPSRWEGLPFALLEAMMRGLPCVATDVGDVATTVGDAGVIVPARDAGALAAALLALTREPARRRELGAAAHRRAAAEYSVDRMVARTVAVYDEVIRR